MVNAALLNSDQFFPVTWDAPLVLEQEMRHVSAAATVKGLFFTDLLQKAKRAGKTIALPWEPSPFRNYPAHDYMRLCTEVAQAIYPHLPLRQSLRQLGTSVFSVFVSSLVGKVMIGVMGNDVVSMLKTLNKATAATTTGCTAETLSCAPGRVVLRLRDVYFADSYQVGFFEGVLQATKKAQGAVRIRSVTPNETLVEVTWKE